MNRPLIISPSIMCCKFWEIKEYIRVFEECGIKLIHFDVMDGHFVDNIMLGTSFYKQLKEMTNIPLDIHFMCEEPERFLDYFHPAEGDWVSFHPETCSQPYRMLQRLRERGVKAGLALLPGIQAALLEEYKSVLEYVLVMTVNPGFAGQPMVPDAPEKIARVRQILDNSGMAADVFADGNTTPDNAKKMRAAGANGFVVGTSSLLSSLEGFPEKYRDYVKVLIQ
ncbi:MAG TPA: ribulose-phosphate 3-epimerase [Anaerovoracaceae bacterium]|nr:ribulose-phosphate 3-epimerase [Anaerovoracaceae bacterium]